MSANSFGNRFCISSFGESHGAGLGVLIDGLPAGIQFDEALLRKDLERRRPGLYKGDKNSEIVSQRNEADEFEILSGIFENKTLGTPIAVLVRNKDQRSEDYDHLKSHFRTGHADDLWLDKFQHRDHRGGGRSSGRETISRVIAGAFAKMFLQQVLPDLRTSCFANQIGPYLLNDEERTLALDFDIDTFPARFPSKNADEVFNALKVIQTENDSYGGVVELVIMNVPKGLGQPVFHKFKSDLAQGLMSIGATMGIELGTGQKSLNLKGSEFHQSANAANYGGIRGGITTGENIICRVMFKPTSSISDIAKKGRHDPCILIRAIPVVEAMSWIVLADHYLWARTDHI